MTVRRAATWLKVAGLAMAVGAVVVGWLSATDDANTFYGNPTIHLPFRYKLQLFLSTSLQYVPLSALVVAAGFALQLAADRVAPAADEFTGEHTDDLADEQWTDPAAPAPGRLDRPLTTSARRPAAVGQPEVIGERIAQPRGDDSLWRP